MKKKPSKKSTRTAANAAPQSAQLEAIRKLLRNGRSEEALLRAEELHNRFPNFKPLLALQWQAADSEGAFSLATLHAWDWSHAAPSSLAALEALRDSAIDAGFVALHLSALVKLAQAQGEPAPELPALHGPLGDISFDEAIASDLSCLYLTFNRFDDVVALLEDATHTTLRNNLALARFAKGEVDAALNEFEQNWQRDPRNLLALQYVVQLRFWKLGRTAASELLPVMRNAEVLRPEDAVAKMFTLLLLDTPEETSTAWKTLANADFWSESSDMHRSICTHLAGIAAWHCGDADAATALVSEAVDLDPANINAEELEFTLSLPEFRESLDLWAGSFREWLPQSWMSETYSIEGEAKWQRCDAHADYLAAATEQGGPAVRFYTLDILQARALSGDAVATGVLRGLLTRQCGPDAVRTELCTWLQTHNLIEAGKAHALLMGGVVREIELLPVRLHMRQIDIGLTPALQSQLEEMHRLIAKNDLQGALRIAKRLNAARPDHPTLIGHVGALKHALGAEPDEVEKLFRRAAELDPDYFFAQVGLAHIAIERGELDRAKALLAPLRRREEFHISEWRALLMADHAIAKADHDLPRAHALLEGIKALNAGHAFS